jgi:hypothetical protein
MLANISVVFANNLHIIHFFVEIVRWLSAAKTVMHNGGTIKEKISALNAIFRTRNPNK